MVLCYGNPRKLIQILKVVSNDTPIFCARYSVTLLLLMRKSFKGEEEKNVQNKKSKASKQTISLRRFLRRAFWCPCQGFQSKVAAQGLTFKGNSVTEESAGRESWWPMCHIKLYISSHAKSDPKQRPSKWYLHLIWIWDLNIQIVEF